MSPITRINLCYWIGGIQNHKLNTGEIQKTADRVNLVLPQGAYSHKVFNWEDKFFERQSQAWVVAQKYGGFWTRLVKKYVNFLGMDMGWYLSTMRGNLASFLSGELHDRLKKSIEGDLEIAVTRSQIPTLWLISHSWGTKVALDYAVNNPDQEVRLITFGSPLTYLSGAYEDWGDPSKLTNIKSWTNIYYEDDPVSAYPFRENLGSHASEWATFVNDVCLPPSVSGFFGLRPAVAIKSHMAYWTDDNFIKVVSTTLLTN